MFRVLLRITRYYDPTCTIKERYSNYRRNYDFTLGVIIFATRYLQEYFVNRLSRPAPF